VFPDTNTTPAHERKSTISLSRTCTLVLRLDGWLSFRFFTFHTKVVGSWIELSWADANAHTESIDERRSGGERRGRYVH
jgi:hypothetical protein